MACESSPKANPDRPTHDVLVKAATDLLGTHVPGFAHRYQPVDELGRDMGDLVMEHVPGEIQAPLSAACAEAAAYLKRQFSRAV